MGSAVLEGGRQEFCFQTTKRSDMECVELQGCRFADCQEWHFHVSKRSDNCSNIMQEGRFADVHE